jgi:predicted enzyme related to lactoylglutathione lyase
MLPTFLLGGLAFALAFGPLNIAATNGIAPQEQGLAGGLVQTSYQLGGALVLAVVTAVNNANVGPDGSPQALLDGFHAALIVPVAAAALGAVAAAVGLVRRAAPAPEAASVSAPPPSSAAVIRRLSGATIWSEDHNNLLPFYRDILGLNVSHQTPELVLLGDGRGPFLSLGTHSEVKGRTSDPDRHYVGLHSEDLDADLVRLQDAGVEIVDGPARDDGVHTLTFKDPEGNVVQLQRASQGNGVAAT